MFKIIGTSDCTYCKKAKELLGLLGFTFEEVSVDDADKRKAIIAAGFTTVPVIYYNGKLIGGFTDLRDTLKSRFEGASFVR